MPTPNPNLPLDRDSIFGKIILGEIPAKVVLETDEALAFLDIRPVAPGHTLLIPKGSYPTLAEMPDELSARLGGLLPRLCRAVLAATGAAGLNVLLNHGAAAGQEVFHAHWHVIPRFEGDAVRWNWPRGSHGEGPDAMDAMAARIRGALGG